MPKRIHLSDETKKKKSIAKSGKNHPFYGKHLSDEHKKKISDAQKKRLSSDEARQKMNKGLKKAWQKRKSGEAYIRFKKERKEILEKIKEMEELKMENDVDYYIDHEYDKDYFTSDIEKQYIKETGKMPYKKGDNDLSKHFKAWLQKKCARDEAEDVLLYKKETGISAYEENNKPLTKEFNEWCFNREK